MVFKELSSEEQIRFNDGMTKLCEPVYGTCNKNSFSDFQRDKEGIITIDNPFEEVFLHLGEIYDAIHPFKGSYEDFRETLINAAETPENILDNLNNAIRYYQAQHPSDKKTILEIMENYRPIHVDEKITGLVPLEGSKFAYITLSANEGLIESGINIPLPNSLTSKYAVRVEFKDGKGYFKEGKPHRGIYHSSGRHL
ncbi:MAG: hypothetical protein KAT28_00955 [Candidatus Aenigmarchaeota archaeon]|nr:hypothetical protein [Candidatus Aenigmarchaeota archaeon]